MLRFAAAVLVLPLALAGTSPAGFLFTATLTRDQEVPPGGPPATSTSTSTSTGAPRPVSFGTATLTLNDEETELALTVTIFNIDARAATSA